jgi:hypothetical protein
MLLIQPVFPHFFYSHPPIPPHSILLHFFPSYCLSFNPVTFQSYLLLSVPSYCSSLYPVTFKSYLLLSIPSYCSSLHPVIFQSYILLSIPSYCSSLDPVTLQSILLLFIPSYCSSLHPVTLQSILLLFRHPIATHSIIVLLLSIYFRYLQLHVSRSFTPHPTSSILLLLFAFFNLIFFIPPNCSSFHPCVMLVFRVVDWPVVVKSLTNSENPTKTFFVNIFSLRWPDFLLRLPFICCVRTLLKIRNSDFQERSSVHIACC